MHFNFFLLLFSVEPKGKKLRVSAQACLTLCDPMDCRPSGTSVHGIFQARIQEWVALSSSWGSSRPRDQACVSYIAGRFFTAEPSGKPSKKL